MILEIMIGYYLLFSLAWAAVEIRCFPKEPAWQQIGYGFLVIPTLLTWIGFLCFTQFYIAASDWIVSKINKVIKKKE